MAAPEWPKGAFPGVSDAHSIETAEPSALRHSSVRGAAATFVGQGARFVVQFLSQILLARLLLPAEFGLVAMVGPVLGLVGVFADLGLTQVTVQRPSITHAELSALFWINVGISAAFALLICVCAPFVAAFYDEPRITPILTCLAAVMMVPGLSAQHVALLNRRMQFSRLAAMDIACTLISGGVGIAAAWHGLGAWSLVLMQAANAATILLMSWINSGWLPSRPRWTPGALRMLRFGGHLTGFNLVTFLATNLDAVMIGKFAGSAALGLYDRSFKLVAAPIWTMSLPIDRVAVSLLSRLHDDPYRYRVAFLQMLQALLLVTLPALAFVVSGVHTIVPLVMGREWAPASPIVAWLAVATAFAPLSIGAYWLFVSQGRAGEQFAFGAVRTAASVLMLLIGLPWGAEGVAIAYGSSGLFLHGLLMWGAARRGPVRHRDLLRTCVPLLLAGLVAGLAASWAEQRTELAGIEALPRMAIAVAVSYLVFAGMRLCLPGGRQLLHSVWALRSTFRPTPLPVVVMS